MTDDDRLLAGLIEESQDLHSDSMKVIREPLDHLVETGQERRARDELSEDEEEVLSGRQSWRNMAMAGVGGLAAAGFGAAVLGLFDEAPAFAASSSSGDVMILQTAASIEVLAVKTYMTALTLPYIGGSAANPVVKAFAQKTMSQHAQHEQAFNGAAQRLGGKAQTNPDPKYVPVVQAAVKKITSEPNSQGALDVVGLALTLENVAAETYVNNMSYLKDSNAKQVTASIMGVEAQHVATLLAVQALLKAGHTSLIAVPVDASKLPAAAGDVAFPNSFYPTQMASTASEGAVQ